MDSSTKLVLIRHGEVEAAYQRVFGGRVDMALSPRGHEQANALAAYLNGQPLDALYLSPMKRAQQTVAPLLALNGHHALTLPGLREVDFGAWTGLGWEQVREQFGVSPFDWLAQLHRDAIAGAEPIAEFSRRVEDCLRQILDGHPGQTVAVLCHGGVIRMMLALLLDLPLPKMANFEINYASVTVVEWRRQRPVVQLLNFSPC